MKYCYRYILLIAVMALTLTAVAQEQPVNIDSLSSAKNDTIQALRSMLQEQQMKNIMMQEQLEKTGEAARDDSLRLVRRKERIDSLRNITPGAPLIIDGDTLLVLYTRRGGILPEARVEDIREKIMEEGKRMTLFTDSIYIFDGEFTTDIMIGEELVMSVTDNDGLWQNKTRQELAAEYRTIIEAKIEQLHAQYGLKRKLMGVVYVLGAMLALGLLIWATNLCYHRWRYRLLRMLLRRTRPLAIKDYEVLNLHRQGILFLTGFNVLRYLIIFLLLFIFVPMFFVAFPETKSFTFTIFGYVWNPFVNILKSVVSFLPKFFQIVVIVFCFRYLVKGLHYLMNEIGSGRLKITGFYADWAQPTYLILRVLCYSFMIVMIWPLLPSSESEVFQGVSVFIGIIVSLGSSSIIGNVMAGMVMTYMRPFHVGDFIKYGDMEGFVIEKCVLVTRIRTRKNDVITIPNSNLMTSQTTNYTFSAHNYGVIVHTKVTIGYDMQWQQIRDLLLAAAAKTSHLQKKPEPFVRITALDDFYVEYEINAYTHKSDLLGDIYSELHQNILDSFHSNGVEIMSPHIFAHRSDLPVQIPEK
ncbi:MAG: mechanosensitive ion channel family protein [Prevotella sp.]|nr:mechanosensitive ion channel family protein [Prevotella sp.]